MKKAFSHKIAIFFTKIKTILFKNRVKITSSFILILLFGVGYFACSLASIGLTKNGYEGIANKMGNDSYICEITSDNFDENFRALFNKADDLAGREIKDYSSSYILSKSNGSYVPIKAKMNEELYVEISNVLQYATWDFATHNYGFKTISNNPVRELDSNEIYIDLNTAKAFAPIIGCNISELAGKSLDYSIGDKLETLVIVDVITNLTECNIGPYFNDLTIITNYSRTSNLFKNQKYIFVLNGGSLSKTYLIKFVEDSIQELCRDGTKKYTTTYYLLKNNTLQLNEVQQVKDRTIAYYRNKLNKNYLYFLIYIFVLLTGISLLTVFKIIGNETIFALFISTTIYSFVMFAFRPTLLLKGVLVPLTNMMASIFIISFFFINIFIYYLFKPSPNEADSKKKEDNLQ